MTISPDSSLGYESESTQSRSHATPNIRYRDQCPINYRDHSESTAIGSRFPNRL